MCTAVAFSGVGRYFGRNLDVEQPYGEQVVVTPRRFSFPLRYLPSMTAHHALIGMAVVARGVPLYFEATNERGLSMAGLSFPGEAVYHAPTDGKDNVCPFELIPWVLVRCADVAQAREALARVQVVDTPFSPEMPLTPLHWLVADGNGSLTVESVAAGLRVYENPVGVLTNSPPFPYHMTRLRDFSALHESAPNDRLCPGVSLEPYSLGMGALGLPGDFSSPSRFVRAVFVKSRSRCVPEGEEVAQFFHVLSAVAMPKGCVRTDSGTYEYTRYSSCCRTDRGVYYYTTYGDGTPRAADLYAGDLEGTALRLYPAVE